MNRTFQILTKSAIPALALSAFLAFGPDAAFAQRSQGGGEMGPLAAAARFRAAVVVDDRFQVVVVDDRFQVVVAVVFLARRLRDGIFLRAAASPAADGVILAPPIRTGPIPVGAGTITRLADTTADETILLAISMPDAVTITADASGLVHTSALVSGSPSATATIRVTAAATTTGGAIGSRLHATCLRTPTTDTDRPYF
jgi:hypothetical protein